MIKNKSITFKLILFLSVSVSCIFIFIAITNNISSEQIILKNIRNNAENLAWRTVNKIETTLESIKQITQGTSLFLEDGSIDKDKITEYLRKVVEKNKELYGIGIAFEPYAFDADSLYFAPYYANTEKGLELVFMGDESYRYFYLDWYQTPKVLNRPIWSEPYFDDVLMATYSIPFYEKDSRDNKKIKGVICTDISLEKLTEIVNSVKILKTGDAFLISKNGTIMAHPEEELIMNETIFSIAEERNDNKLRQIGQKMVRGESGFAPFTSIARHKNSWMYYAPVASTGWSIGVVFPEDELFADTKRQLITAFILGILGLALFITIIVTMSQSITKPLTKISQAAKEIGSGNLDIELPAVTSNDEVGILTNAFGQMKISLKDYIEKLKETTAAKERIESELSIAKEIQTSILPRTFPAFPQKTEFDIYAMMEPAKEVGGDFYDFCLIDDKKLYFCIGDVSGKGVPAALFMMIAKTLLKNEALRGASSSEILYSVNNIIALDNTTSMFATVFCGILDIESRELDFSNAGHNPPLTFNKKEEKWEFLKVEKGFVLGPIRNFQYKSQKIKFLSGDTLFLFTDGVTEAMDKDKKLFTESKLLEVVSLSKEKSLVDMINDIRAEIKNHAKDEPQSDDITMLNLRIN